MGLEQVVADVQRATETKAQSIVEDAKAEAAKLLDAARSDVDAYTNRVMARAQQDADQEHARIVSAAEFEARKMVLTKENDLRAKLRSAIVDGLAKLDAGVRKDHLAKLVQTAQATISSGTLFVTASDADQLPADHGYTVDASLKAAGGLIVESEDRELRLDLRYETLLDDTWRDVLRQEAGLFA